MESLKKVKQKTDSDHLRLINHKVGKIHENLKFYTWVLIVFFAISAWVALVVYI